MQWLSRTLAVVLLMILPGMAGGWLDRQFSTTYLMPLGFALGVIAGTTLLVFLARLFTPSAGEMPLDRNAPSDKGSTESGDESSNESDRPEAPRDGF